LQIFISEKEYRFVENGTVFHYSIHAVILKLPHAWKPDPYIKAALSGKKKKPAKSNSFDLK
jgi:hypothetical protein